LLAGDHGRLDDAHQAEVDGVCRWGDLEAGRVGQALFAAAAVPEEGVPAGYPDHRGDADVLEARRKRDRRVEAGADPLLEHVPCVRTFWPSPQLAGGSA
jgi:hypothetical protein